VNTDFLRIWAPIGKEPTRDIHAVTLDAARVPREFWRNEPTNLIGLAHAAPVMDYLANIEEHHRKRRGLLLWGSRGTGKSSIAARVLIEVMRRADPITRTMWVSARECAQFMRDYQREDRDERRYSERLLWNHWVVIDELGGEEDWAGGYIEEAVKGRYHNRRPTVLTTNLPLEDAKKRYQWLEGLISQRYRIIEVPDAKHGGKDWRTQPKPEEKPA